MKTKKIILLAFVGVVSMGLLTLSSCSKDGAAGSTGPQGASGVTGPNLQGSIYGYVSLYNQYGTRLYLNLKNINVSLIGTSTVNTKTDSVGHYSFTNVSTGTYNITVSDSSYGSMQMPESQFVGGGSAERDAKLSQIPNFNALTAVAVDTIGVVAGDTTKYIKVRGAVNADNYGRNLAFFIGTSSGTSSNPANYILTYPLSRLIPGKAVTYTTLIPVTDLYGAGFITGNTAYIAVYGASVNYTSTSAYEDLNTGRTIYNALSANATNTNVIVP